MYVGTYVLVCTYVHISWSTCTLFCTYVCVDVRTHMYVIVYVCVETVYLHVCWCVRVPPPPSPPETMGSRPESPG